MRTIICEMRFTHTIYLVNKALAWMTNFCPLIGAVMAKSSINQLKKFHRSGAKRGCALIEACTYITTYTVFVWIAKFMYGSNKMLCPWWCVYWCCLKEKLLQFYKIKFCFYLWFKFVWMTHGQKNEQNMRRKGLIITPIRRYFEVCRHQV